MSGRGGHWAPYPPPESRWRRPLTPMEVGGLLAGLVLILVFCGLCCAGSTILPVRSPEPVVATTSP